MAKIRTVKPDLFRHDSLFEAEQAHQLPLRLAFIGLFTCCDREGRFRWRPKQLKLDIFPFDNIDMTAVLDALADAQFIEKYEANGEIYGCVPSWRKHQCVNHREAESQLPARETGALLSKVPIKNNEIFSKKISPKNISQARLGTPRGKGNGNGREMEVEVEVEVEVEREVEMEREMEKEMEREMNVVAPTALTSHAVEHPDSVFAHWKKTMKHPHAKLDHARKTAVQNALALGYNTAQLCEAIEGCSKTPHNIGMNDKGQRYDGLHLILRNADQIDRFIHNCHNPPSALNSASQRLRSNAATLQDWALAKRSQEEKHHAHT